MLIVKGLLYHSSLYRIPNHIIQLFKKLRLITNNSVKALIFPNRP